jgi:hypothetical protein
MVFTLYCFYRKCHSARTLVKIISRRANLLPKHIEDQPVGCSMVQDAVSSILKLHIILTLDLIFPGSSGSVIFDDKIDV